MELLPVLCLPSLPGPQIQGTSTPGYTHAIPLSPCPLLMLPDRRAHAL